jgi:hypothetical protein
LELPDRLIETITELSQGDRAAESAMVGAHHQTGAFDVAFLAGGRRKVTDAQSASVAQPVSFTG